MNVLEKVISKWDVERTSTLLHWGCDAQHIARFCKGRVAYLASPVTGRAAEESAQGDPGWFIMQRLELECALDLDALARAGVCVVSPVLQALKMIESRGSSERMHGSLGLLDQDGWMRWGGPLLRACGALVVTDRPGWNSSRGIAREVEYALAVNKMVFFAAPQPSWPD